MHCLRSSRGDEACPELVEGACPELVEGLSLLTPARDSAPTDVGDYNQVAADVSPRKLA